MAVQEAEVSGRRSGGAQPSWSEGLISGGSGEDGPSSGTEEWVPQMARIPVPEGPRSELEVAERPSGMLDFLSQVGFPPFSDMLAN